MRLEKALASLDRQINRHWRTMNFPPEIDQISCNEYDYLKSIQFLGEPRLSEVAEELAVQKPSASNMTARLEKKGLIQRTPCTDDKRATRVSLSEKGHELLRYDTLFYSSLADSVRNKLSTRDIKELERLLGQVVNKMVEEN